MSITTNFAQISRQLDALQRGIQKATVRALNKTATQAEAVMAREMQANLGVPAAKIAKVLRIDRARDSGRRLSLRATLEVRARTAVMPRVGAGASVAPGPLLNRRVVQARQRAKGMMGKGRRVAPRRLPLGTALARGGAARLLHPARARLPIKASLNAEVARLFNDKHIQRKTLAAIQARSPAIFEREMRVAVDRFNSGAAPRQATPPSRYFLEKNFARVG